MLAVPALIVSQYWLGVVPNWATWLVVVAIVQFVIQPLSTLVHELGHACAVTLIGRRQSSVIVGRGPWLTVKRRRVTVHFSVLATRGVRIAGVCRFDRSGLSWKQLGWIALAGPLATAAQLIVVLAIAPLLWAHGRTIRIPRRPVDDRARYQPCHQSGATTVQGTRRPRDGHAARRHTGARSVRASQSGSLTAAADSRRGCTRSGG